MTMRAQFATIEALISLLAVLFVITFVSAQISLSNRTAYFARSGLVQGMAVYDAFDQIADNSSANRCASLAVATEDAPCLAGMVASYKEAFGLREFSVVLAGVSAGDAGVDGTRVCAPVRLASLNETSEVCIIASS
jgi:hypothetical protein